MALDPIVSLSVGIAEAPGSYAFFLGSGVSRDAGVPTGGEVFWLAVGDLYRVDTSTEATPSQGGLADWLSETGRGELGYSDVLELIAPDAAIRREYLAKHFEGVEPGSTHERLADLAERGLARVFVTTNFDRLLEIALQARGIQPIVVTSSADLDVAPGREHSECYVVKPHGDYLQQTIRNTPAELAELPAGVTAELREIFDRYGLVVLGYSGADQGIGQAMRARRSRYGAYWVSRGEPAQPAAGLVEALNARVIRREGSAAFLADLDRRLAVFESHPSGETPASVNDEVVHLLRRSDRVGITELLRRERREYERAISGMIDSRHQEQPSAEVAGEVHDMLSPVLERRLASLLPLALHDAEALTAEFRGLASFRAHQPRTSGYVFWGSVVDWAAWWLGLTVGAFSIEQEAYEALSAVLDPRVADDFGGGAEPLVASYATEAAAKIGEAVMARMSDQRWYAPAWEALRTEINGLSVLIERYPELVASQDQPLRSLVAFDFLQDVALGVAGLRSLSHWTMYTSHAEAFARHLHGDPRLRERIARALHLTLPEFDEQAPEALMATHALGEFPDRDAVNLLRTGTRR